MTILTTKPAIEQTNKQESNHPIAAKTQCETKPNRTKNKIVYTRDVERDQNSIHKHVARDG